jgi:L-ascorbate metabolism protein UlaG (beta-lactamase superfamily)
MPVMGRFDDRATRPQRGLGDILRWNVVDRFTGRSRRDRTPFQPPTRAPDPAPLLAGGDSLTWVGHATFAARLAGKLVLTDPIFSERIAGTVKRRAPPGVPLDGLPVDLVTISHNHRDHLDLATLARIGPGATYVVPLGNGAILRKAGLSEIVELDWWQTHVTGELSVTLVPARHWSMRFPWDRNDMLWGGFVLRSPEASVYHAGDTALFDGFEEIGARCGPIDYAMLPIGAYEPRWFMEPQHMNPEDAAHAFAALGARTLVAMHWGTFQLTDEPLAEPPERLRAQFAARGWPEERLWVLDVGENRRLVP